MKHAPGTVAVCENCVAAGLPEGKVRLNHEGVWSHLAGRYHPDCAGAKPFGIEDDIEVIEEVEEEISLHDLEVLHTLRDIRDAIHTSNKISEEIKTLMTTATTALTDLTAAISANTTLIQTSLGLQKTIIVDLETLIQNAKAGGTGVDPDAVEKLVSLLSGNNSSLTDSNAQMQTAVNDFTQSQAPAPTQATISFSPSTTVTAGVDLNLSATVTGTNPTGTITFMDGTTELGSGPVGPDGSVSIDVPAGLAAGTHDLTAFYSGDAGNSGVSSAVIVVTAS